jgi:biopolymer transport protein ExbB/TolQ
VCLVHAVWSVIASFSLQSVMSLVLVLAVGIVFFYSRTFALAVQDRLIRLEERLRLERILPDSLRARVGDFTTEQLVALRFASDAELPALAQSVLDENKQDREEIKRQIKQWRADHQRA